MKVVVIIFVAVMVISVVVMVTMMTIRLANNAGDIRHKGSRGKRKQWIGKQKKLSSTGCSHTFV